jgi:hypothetical protein
MESSWYQWKYLARGNWTVSFDNQKMFPNGQHKEKWAHNIQKINIKMIEWIDNEAEGFDGTEGQPSGDSHEC